VATSVADSEGLSQIYKTTTKEDGEKLVVLPTGNFVVINFTKLNLFNVLEQAQKKI
jgi:hypothetical protein